MTYNIGAIKASSWILPGPKSSRTCLRWTPVAQYDNVSVPVQQLFYVAKQAGLVGASLLAHHAFQHSHIPTPPPPPPPPPPAPPQQAEGIVRHGPALFHIFQCRWWLLWGSFYVAKNILGAYLTSSVLSRHM